MMTRRSFVKTAASAATVAAVSGLAAGTALADETDEAEAEQPAESASGNRVCEVLGIEKPVVQAFMSGLTSPELCAAVSNAGGLGIIGMPAQEDLDTVKSLTDKPFCAAFYAYDDETMQMLKDAGVGIVFVLGQGTKETDYAVDTDTIKLLKDNGFTVLYRDVNTTVPALVAAQDAGADIVIASGYGQGGHMTETRITLTSMLAEAKPQVTVPLMASGCIVDAETAAAAAAMGAEGAYVGTRFNASEESPCSDYAKQVIVDSRAEDLVEWRASVGFVRANDCEFSQEVIQMANAGATAAELSEKYMGMFAAMRSGDESMAVNMDDAVNRITDIKTCQEIVDDIASAFLG